MGIEQVYVEAHSPDKESIKDIVENNDKIMCNIENKCVHL